MADPSDDSLRIQKAYAGPGVYHEWISAVRFLAAAAAGVERAAARREGRGNDGGSTRTGSSSGPHRSAWTARLVDRVQLHIELLPVFQHLDNRVSLRHIVGLHPDGVFCLDDGGRVFAALNRCRA